WNYEQLNTVERVLLAQRIAGEPDRTVRYLNDIVRLQPPNSDRLRALFETGVQRSDLDAKPEFAIGLRLAMPVRAPTGSAGAVSGGGMPSAVATNTLNAPADLADRLGRRGAQAKSEGKMLQDAEQRKEDLGELSKDSKKSDTPALRRRLADSTDY